MTENLGRSIGILARHTGKLGVGGGQLGFTSYCLLGMQVEHDFIDFVDAGT